MSPSWLQVLKFFGKYTFLQLNTKHSYNPPYEMFRLLETLPSAAPRSSWGVAAGSVGRPPSRRSSTLPATQRFFFLALAKYFEHLFNFQLSKVEMVELDLLSLASVRRLDFRFFVL